MESSLDNLLLIDRHILLFLIVNYIPVLDNKFVFKGQFCLLTSCMLIFKLLKNLSYNDEDTVFKILR